MIDSPFARFLGFERRDDGIAILRIDESHLSDRAASIVHGGVIAAFMETLAGSEAGGETVDFTSDFLRPAGRTPLLARAITLRRGRRFATVRVEVWHDGSTDLVASGTGSFRLDCP